MSVTEIIAAKVVLQQNGRSFHFASHVLGKKHGERAARLYALCRAIDDLADDAISSTAAEDRLIALSKALERRDGGDKIAAAALSLHHEAGLDLSALQALISGMRSDLQPVRIADEAALIDYCYTVAGTVGLMMCNVLEVKDPHAAPFAIDLGIAMQLTNIARDIGIDARIGRRYIPAAWIGELEPECIFAPEKAEKLKAAVKRLLALADCYYISGEAGLCYLPIRARLSILIAARVYRAIGGRIAALGYEAWRKRAVVSTGRKIGVGTFALAEFLLNPRLHQISAQHDAQFHTLIQHRPLTHQSGGSDG